MSESLPMLERDWVDSVMGEDAVFHTCPQMGCYLLVLLCMMKYSKLMLQMKSEDFSPFALSRCVAGQSGSGELLGTGRSPCLLRSLGFFFSMFCLFMAVSRSARSCQRQMQLVCFTGSFPPAHEGSGSQHP